jgi:DNA-binding transcriptional regulator GbsR (MarR family)
MPVQLDERHESSSQTDGEKSPMPLNPIESEVVDLFVQLSRLLGQPPSLGEIYGLLFISPRPLAMDDFMEQLRLSKGSASQGLKFLRNLGAVHPVTVNGDRRVHYQAVAELRKLAGSFLRERVQPYLGNGEQRLDRLAALADKLPPGQREHASRRIALLRSWSRNSRRVLPLVLKVLSG